MSIRRRLMVSTLSILALAAAFAVATTFLPDNPYQRSQLMAGTVYAKAQWNYERMHFDPRPIDVAIFGDSRTLIGLEPDRVGAKLAMAGKPAEVVNMSLVGEGRNLQSMLVRDLLETKRPKVLIFAITGQPSPWGHDAFKYLGSSADIWREAGLGLYDTRKNLMYLPFRQMKLFAARLAPGSFGLRARFDEKTYIPAQDNWLTARRTADGQWLDPTKRVARDLLMKHVEAGGERRSKLPAPLRRFTDADDRVNLDLIAAAAARRGVKILFVYIPPFHHHDQIKARAYYDSLGVVQDNADIAEHDELYMDPHHTNLAGSQIVSDRVAASVAELLP